MHGGRNRVKRPHERRDIAFAVQRNSPSAIGVMFWEAIAYGILSPLFFVRNTL